MLLLGNHRRGQERDHGVPGGRHDPVGRQRRLCRAQPRDHTAGGRRRAELGPRGLHLQLRCARLPRPDTRAGRPHLRGGDHHQVRAKFTGCPINSVDSADITFTYKPFGQVFFLS